MYASVFRNVQIRGLAIFWVLPLFKQRRMRAVLKHARTVRRVPLSPTLVGAYP